MEEAWLMELVYPLITSISLLKGVYLPINTLGHSFGKHTLIFKNTIYWLMSVWTTYLPINTLLKAHECWVPRSSIKKKKVPTFMIPTLMELLSTLRKRINGLKFPRSMEINVFFIGKNGCPPNIIDILWNLF